MTRTQPRFRRRLATFFVALYAFCVLAPHAALALAHGTNAAHCLTQTASSPHQHAANSAHSHESAAAHDHGSSAKIKTPVKADDTGAQTACCGLFFMSALAAESNPFAMLATPGKTIAAAAPEGLTGHSPGRLIEPPIA